MRHCFAGQGFNAHPTVVKLFKDRAEQIETGRIDMAQAELLAFGSLMLPLLGKKAGEQQIGRIKRPLSDVGGEEVRHIPCRSRV